LFVTKRVLPIFAFQNKKGYSPERFSYGKEPEPSHCHHYPAKVIRHAVLPYFRFTFSFRDREEMLAYRGVIVTYEAIRQWTLKFGQDYTNTMRQSQLRPGSNGIWILNRFVYDNLPSLFSIS